MPLTLTIQTVNDQTRPATVSPPSPWLVVGTVAQASNTATLTAMAYQIDDGPVNSFLPPFTSGTTPTTFYLNLFDADLNSDGTHVLTVFLFDSDNSSRTDDFSIICQNFSSSGPLNPPPITP